MEDEDLALALALQDELNNESPQTPFPTHSSSKNKSKNVTSPSLVDEFWELTDPNPDIRALFLQFNERFFWGRLFAIEVKWSSRMTSCAGICCYEGRGGLCSVRLSTPLLKLRPRKDLVETLLHEMIHAYLFVTDNNKDHDGHGPEFHKHMYRINSETGTNISVYHSFHDEVELYKTHWWKCNGPCQKQSPYYGMVKRSMNRAPAKNDSWWAEHQKTCGGTYTKVKEPEGFGQKKKGGKNTEKGYKSDSEMEKKKSKSPDIRSFWGKGKPVKNDKPATVTSGDLKTVLTNGNLQKKGSGDGGIGFPSNGIAKTPFYMGDNSSKTIDSDHSSVNEPNLPALPTHYDSDSNVMGAKTIWNTDKEPPVSRPTFTGQGQMLGKEDKNQVMNKTNMISSSSNKSSKDSDLNVMSAKTIWNKDKAQEVCKPAFTGQGNTLGQGNTVGQGQGGLSWLAQFRKGMVSSGSKKTSESSAQFSSDDKHLSEKASKFGFNSEKWNNVNSRQKQESAVIGKQNGSALTPSNSDFTSKKRKELFDSYFKVDKTKLDVKSGKKIKKAVLVLSDSDEDDFEPVAKKIRQTNWPDIPLPTITSPTSRKSKDFSEKSQGNNSMHSNFVDKHVPYTSELPIIKSPTSRASKSPQKKSSPSTSSRAIPDYFTNETQTGSSSLPNSAINTVPVEAVPMSNCPVCQMEVSTVEINNHLDLCLSVS